MAGTRLELLGRFRVLRAGVEVPPPAFGGRKVRTLLRLLAVRRPDLVPHDVLADALWPDRVPADPAGNLNVLVHRARTAVGDPGLVVTGPGGYALGPCTVDAEEFLAATARARRAAAADPAGALRAATVALELWGEPLPEDTYADWAREPRERLLRARVEALEAAAEAALTLGDPGAAAGHAARAVAADPLREPAVLVLARALAAAGDRAGALARLADLRRALADELGVDPSPRAAALQRSLLHGDLPPTGQASPSAFGELPFVGRDAELAAVHRTLAAGGVAAVAGVAGVGKSRLLAEVVRRSGRPVVAARAVLPELADAWGLAGSLLRAALAVDDAVAAAVPALARDALAGLLPELGGRPVVLDGETRRALQLAGGVRMLEAAAAADALLVVDDLQWADPSSLGLLGSALARLPRLAAVLAFRPDELRPGVLADLRAVREMSDVPLGPLSASALGALVGNAELAQALGESTDRTPFAVAEVLRELVTRDAVDAGPDGWHPREHDVAGLAVDLGRAGQRRAIHRRVERHAAGADTLAVVALLAREAPARTVAAATGHGEAATMDELAGLADAGLLRLGGRGWTTAHDLVGETVVAGLPAGERARLHGALARALETGDADPSEIARHHRESGDAAAAAAAYASAATGALDGHATREARTLADAGLALDPRPPVRATLLDVRAEARAAHGDLAGALADLRAAVPLSTGGNRARRLARLAMLTSGAQDPHRAADLAELALIGAADDDAARAVALETAAILDMNLGRPERATERADAALALFRRLGDERGVARILDGRAMATFLDGRIVPALAVFERVAQLFTESGDLLRVVTPRSTRGHGLVFHGRPADGLAETSAALRIARDLDAPEAQAYALWHRSEALSALGRGEEAEADAVEALRLARSLGHRGWTATAHRARGIALEARGRLDDAAAAYAASAAAAGDDLALFASWAAARAALVAVETGRLAPAAPLVRRALATGPALGHYEARLAAVELAVAEGAADADRLAATALDAARAGGHAASVARLLRLAPGLDAGLPSRSSPGR
ncbi:AAA family ATPase [Pseudonocardia sp. C8]|uniref:BTAD domain-containing putative transcriptional regulator n=1 Tax=Pseudonocardia sp. C8 TaxID=2762759 RepID=UPI001643645A|nr:BTAD domain-containing putative transcriptional regulator [Pseudonocardia sp. C8]MBC3193479.1 AAA family ATPase [Pseudonocardia sp. C8]